jgi:hypothetical protein
MSFDHKAYSFDWQSFSEEVLPWFPGALARGDCHAFRSFIFKNQNFCRDPYEGEPLGAGWEKQIDLNDVQQLADFALTKYYDPSESRGLADSWMELSDGLPPDLRKCLLGDALEGFNPGLQGSYFLTPEEARRQAQMLEASSNMLVQEYRRFLEQAANTGKGAYITF